MSEPEPVASPPAAAPERAPVSPRDGRSIWGRTLAAPLLVALTLAWLAGERGRSEAAIVASHAAMRVDMPVPAFELVERSGQKLSSASLAGTPYVASFIFTRCQGPCPLVSAQVRRLQAQLAGEADGPLHGTNVRLVTITVDPEHDSPEVLSRHAEKLTADPALWSFVTGEPAAVRGLLREGFHAGVENKADAPPAEAITHDTHLVLVDARGHIRGFYESGEAADVAQLVQDARREWALATPGRASSLPLVNAILNATSALLLLLGYAAIRAGAVARHKACMLGAFVVSAVFLACYLAHHAQNGSTPFAGEGLPRTVYLVLLASHVVLAVVVLPFELATLWLGLKGNLAKHAAIARWTLPVWVYVSCTGVAVYLVLYRIFA